MPTDETITFTHTYTTPGTFNASASVKTATNQTVNSAIVPVVVMTGFPTVTYSTFSTSFPTNTSPPESEPQAVGFQGADVAYKSGSRVFRIQPAQLQTLINNISDVRVNTMETLDDEFIIASNSSFSFLYGTAAGNNFQLAILGAGVGGGSRGYVASSRLSDTEIIISNGSPRSVQLLPTQLSAVVSKITRATATTITMERLSDYPVAMGNIQRSIATGGRSLCFGGRTNTTTTSNAAYIYNVAADTYQTLTVPDAVSGRWNHAIIDIGDFWLITGGVNAGATAAVTDDWVVDKTNGTFTPRAMTGIGAPPWSGAITKAQTPNRIAVLDYSERTFYTVTVT